MTQRIFDIENEQDMKDLWEILPDEIKSLYRETDCSIDRKTYEIEQFIKIKWNNCYEIHRPIQEATEADIGKLCCFWYNEYNPNDKIVGVLCGVDCYSDIDDNPHKYVQGGGYVYRHCRRLTKQEIEELC